jgi:hypothetical protein
MLENEIDIALIQEPYVVDNQIRLFPINFQIIQSEDHPKVGIVLNPKKAKIMAINKHINKIQVWALIKYQNIEIHVCSAYMPPPEDINISINNLQIAINEIRPKNLIICSDTNAKSKLWFSKTNNRRGQEVIDFMVNNDLLIMNNSEIPTFMASFGESSIDLTFINRHIFDSIQNWKIELTETNSDNYIDS